MDRPIQIAFFDTKPYDRRFFDAANANGKFHIRYYETRLAPASASMAQGFDAVCAFVNDDLGAGTIGKLHEFGVRLLAMRCAGFNNVDLPAALDKVDVVRVPAYSPFAVAEYTLGLILCLNRKLHRAYCRVRENNFSINGFIGFDLHGKTVGVAGTGKIGRTFIHLLSGFGVRVLMYDPYPNEAFAEESGGKYVDFKTLCRESDIISLHCPLTPDNLHMINRESIDLMKDGVMIVNTSRGKLINTPDLIKGLKTGKIGAAGLDVYEEESEYFFEDRSDEAIPDDVLARLMTFPNVLISSHQAFFTREAMHNIAQTTLENVRLYFEEDKKMPNGICNFCKGGKCVHCRKN